MYKETFLNLIEKDKNIPFFIIEKENYSFLESHKIQKILGVEYPHGDETINFFEFCPVQWRGLFRGTFLELVQLSRGASIDQRLYLENGTYQKIEIINDKESFIVKLKSNEDLNENVSFLKLVNHLLLKDSNDAIFVIDKKLKVLFYNEASKELGIRLLGKVDDINAKLHYFLEKYERLKIGVTKAFKGEEFQSELSYFLHSGEQVFLKTHYQPIYLQGQERNNFV